MAISTTRVQKELRNNKALKRILNLTNIDPIERYRLVQKALRDLHLPEHEYEEFVNAIISEDDASRSSHKELQPLTRQQQQQSTVPGAAALVALPGGLAAEVFNHYRIHPTMEDDPRYKKIYNERVKTWEKRWKEKNPPSTDKQEYQNRYEEAKLDYLHGSLDPQKRLPVISDQATGMIGENPNYTPYIHDEVRREFEAKHTKRAQQYLKKDQKEYEEDKVHKDPHVKKIKKHIENHIDDRTLSFYQQEKRKNPNLTYPKFHEQNINQLTQLKQQIASAAWERFPKAALPQYSKYIATNKASYVPVPTPQQARTTRELTENPQQSALLPQTQAKIMSSPLRPTVKDAPVPEEKMTSDYTNVPQVPRQNIPPQDNNDKDHEPSSPQSINLEKIQQRIRTFRKIKDFISKNKIFSKVLNFLKDGGKLIFNGLKNLFELGVEGITNLAGIFGGAGGTEAIVATEGVAATETVIATGGGGIALATTIVVILFWIIIILVVITVLVILILLLIANVTAPQALTHLNCGSTDTKFIQDTVRINLNGTQPNIKLAEQQFQNRYFIDFGINFPQNQTAGQDMTKVIPAFIGFYSNICQLFGHHEGSLLAPGTFNTFGKYVVGTDTVKNPNRQALYIIFYLTNANADPNADCDVKDDKTMEPGASGGRGQYHDIGKGRQVWEFMNVDKCITGTGENTQATPRLQFLIARTLGYTLLSQQAFLKQNGVKTNFNINDFDTQVYNVDPKLPTHNCSASGIPNPGNSLNFGVGTGVSGDCFADMIGSYYTYGTYADFGSTNGSGGNCGGNGGSCAQYLVDTLKTNPKCEKVAGNVPPFQYLNGYAKIDQADTDIKQGDNKGCVPTNITYDKKIPGARGIGGPSGWFATSVNETTVLQCLTFIAAVAEATNHPIHLQNVRGTSYGIAKEVYYDPPTKAGYITVPNDGAKGNGPKIGDIAVFDGTAPGHIAYVTNIYPDGTIQIAEANGHGNGEVDNMKMGIHDRFAGGLFIVGWVRQP